MLSSYLIHIYIYSSPFSSIMCRLPVFTHLHIQFSLLQYHVSFVRLYTFTYTVLPSPVPCVVCSSLHIYIYSSPFSSTMCRFPVFTHLHIQFSLLQYHVSFARLYTFTYTVLPSPVPYVVCPSLHIYIYSSSFSSIMCRLPVFTHLHIQFSLLQYHVSFARLYTFTYTVLPSPVSCVVCPSLHIYIYSSPFSSIMCRLPVFTHLHIQFSLLQYHVSFARLYTFTYTVLPTPVSCVVCPSLHIYIYSSPYSSTMCRLSFFTHLQIQFSLLQYHVSFARLYTFTYTVLPSPVSCVVCPSLQIYIYSSPFSSIMCRLPVFTHLHIQFSLLQYHVSFARLYTFTYTVLPSPVSCVVCPSLHIYIYSSPFSSIMCRLPVFTHLHIQFSLLQYHVSFARLYTFTYTVLPSPVSCVVCPSLHIYIYSSPFSSTMCRLLVFTHLHIQFSLLQYHVSFSRLYTFTYTVLPSPVSCVVCPSLHIYIYSSPFSSTICRLPVFTHLHIQFFLLQYHVSFARLYTYSSHFSSTMCRLPVFTHLHIQFSLLQYHVWFVRLYTFTYTVLPSPVCVCRLSFFTHLQIQFSLLQYHVSFARLYRFTYTVLHSPVSCLHVSFARLYTFTYTVLPSPVSCVVCPSLHIYIYSSPFSSIMCGLSVFTHLHIQFSLLQYHVSFVRLYTFTYTVLPSPVSCVVCPSLHIYIYSSPFSSTICRLFVFTHLQIQFSLFQ